MECGSFTNRALRPAGDASLRLSTARRIRPRFPYLMTCATARVIKTSSRPMEGRPSQFRQIAGVYRWLVGGLVVVAVVVLTAMFVPSDFEQSRHPFAGPAKQVVEPVLPGAIVPNVEGGDIDLAALRGKPAVINLWATWGGPCRREMPALERLPKE